jgi:DnaK suppressor protein
VEEEMSEGLSEGERAELLALLSKRLDEMDRRLSAWEGLDVVELDQSRMGRLSRVDAIQRQQMAKKQRNRAVQQRQHIFLALRRLELYPEDFGLCDECGESIPMGRLLIKPSARSCIACLEAKDA